MVKVLIGNLFDSKAQTLVNTVNCVGIMGKGIALEFKKRFTDMFEDYAIRCSRNEIKLGFPYLYKNLFPPHVLNFPTKDHWRSVAKLENIVNGFDHLLKMYKEWGITSMAVPPLGCGEGKLEWRIVGPTLYHYLNQMDIPIEFYAPYGTPHEELMPEFLDNDNRPIIPEPERIQPSWVAIVEILKQIESQPYHWPVGRTMFQKIAYVATAEGLPTNLDYQECSYGPFAPSLKGIITQLVNNGLIREERKGNMLAVKVGSTFAHARKAYAQYIEQWEDTIEKVTDLFMRLSNTAQAEMVTTVLFASRSFRSTEEYQPSEMDVVNKVMEWKRRRNPPLKETEVASTVRNLAAFGWLDVKASDDLPLPEDDLIYA